MFFWANVLDGSLAIGQVCEMHHVGHKVGEAILHS